LSGFVDLDIRCDVALAGFLHGKPAASSQTELSEANVPGTAFDAVLYFGYRGVSNRLKKRKQNKPTLCPFSSAGRKKYNSKASSPKFSKRGSAHGPKH